MTLVGLMARTNVRPPITSRPLRMALTNDTLTVWELVHRMAGKDPHAWSPFGLSLVVKDNLRLLLNEILHGHLEFCQ